MISAWWPMQFAVRAQSHGLEVHREIRILSTASKVRSQPIKKWTKPARGIKARRRTTNKCKTRTRCTDCQILNWSRSMHGTGTLAENAFCQPIPKRVSFMKIAPILQFKIRAYPTCILQCINNCHYKATLTFSTPLLNDTHNVVLWQIPTLNHKG